MSNLTDAERVLLWVTTRGPDIVPPEIHDTACRALGIPSLAHGFAELSEEAIDPGRKPVETWPKYYICGTWDHAAYVRTDSDGRITTICRDGSECRWDVETKLTAVLPDGWRSVTKAEALARVKAPAPVESIPAAVDHTPAPPVTAAIEHATKKQPTEGK
jgi:hypothetical protein